MDKQSKKLELSKETLLSLEDQDLAGVAGGNGALINTVVCNSGVCNSGAVCQSAVCYSAVCSTICL